MSESTVLLEAVSDVAQLAGEAALAHFQKAPAVELKRDGTPVTMADREAEKRARSWIEERFPDDGILGEEFGLARPEAPRRWLIDPIDGTKSFVRGVPLWGSLIAVVEGAEVLAGAACFPALNETVAAALGKGCWRNGGRCAVSVESEISRATVLNTDWLAGQAEQREAWTKLAARSGLARTWGDCYGYLLVATGIAEAMIDPIASPWDLAAVMVIVEEAGGRFTDWRGARTFSGESAIATNANLADVIRDALSEASRETPFRG